MAETTVRRGRPPVVPPGDRVKVVALMRGEDVEALDRLAEAEMRSRADVIRRLVREALQEQGLGAAAS